MDFESLNDVYKYKEIYYWCNCGGEIKMPKDLGDEHYTSDELPPQAKELYETYMSEGNGCLEYVVNFRGKTAYAFGMLFPKEWIKNLQIPRIELFSYIKRMSAEIFPESLFENCTFLFGDNTDPLGSELLIVLPYEEREKIPEIQRGFFNRTFDESHLKTGTKFKKDKSEPIGNELSRTPAPNHKIEIILQRIDWEIEGTQRDIKNYIDSITNYITYTDKSHIYNNAIIIEDEARRLAIAAQELRMFAKQKEMLKYLAYD